MLLPSPTFWRLYRRGRGCGPETGRRFFLGCCQALSNCPPPTTWTRSHSVGTAVADMHPSNVGASTLQVGAAQGERAGVGNVVNVVSLEDLLYNAPEHLRPKVTVTRKDPGTGLPVTTVEPLRPELIYMVKCDVEGFDGPVTYR
jgi:hypothetical protein